MTFHGPRPACDVTSLSREHARHTPEQPRRVQPSTNDDLVRQIEARRELEAAAAVSRAEQELQAARDYELDRVNRERARLRKAWLAASQAKQERSA